MQIDGHSFYDGKDAQVGNVLCHYLLLMEHKLDIANYARNRAM